MERDLPTCPPQLPEHPIHPRYFTGGMHVLFGVLTFFTCGIAALPWGILYAVQKRSEERDYDEAMIEYGDAMTEYNAAMARYQAGLMHRPTA